MRRVGRRILWCCARPRCRSLATPSFCSYAGPLFGLRSADQPRGARPPQRGCAAQYALLALPRGELRGRRIQGQVAGVSG